MQREGLDALIVCGNQYAGFEGAVLYMSGFEIVHRYVYVFFPLEGEPALVFPREARWIGDKAKPWVRDQVWPDVPGKWIAERSREKGYKRVGVYGLNFVMAVRDYRELAAGSLEIVPFDTPFDMARAVKSDEELAEIRDAMDIIVDGFWALVAAYEPGKTEAEIMAPAVERFFARGAGSRMMNILLSGGSGEAEAAFKVPGNRVVARDDLLLYSLEITGTGGYWVEFSRPLIRGQLSRRTQAMADAYPDALEAARKLMHAGELASTVHHAVAEKFAKHGFALGHLSGHSIGATMIEYPAIGVNSDVVLEENMIFSLHPQVVDQDGKVCLYTQDTYRIGAREGECLADVPWKFYTGEEVRERAVS
jgi:Xaa-Pro aminopeptidase